MIYRKEGNQWRRKDYLDLQDITILQGLSQQALAWMSQQQSKDYDKRDRAVNLELVTTLAGAKDLNVKRNTKA